MLSVGFAPLQILAFFLQGPSLLIKPIDIKTYNYTWPILRLMAFSMPWLLTASAPD